MPRLNNIEPLKARFLEANVVVVVEVVDADDFIAGGKQPLGDVHADEPGRAGDQDFQGATATWSALPRMARGASRTNHPQVRAQNGRMMS